MEQKFDPKLKAAMEEIKAICQKNDVVGFISLASQTHGEYALSFPKWSPVFIEDNVLRFRSVGKDYTSKSEHKRHLTLGAWAICQLQDMGMELHKMMTKMRRAVESRVEIDHSPMHGFTPHIDTEVLSHDEGGGKSET